MIQVQNFFIQYQNFSLSLPYLHLENKGIVLLSGNNGCGKTSLLRSIAGFNDQYQGNILINNKPVKNMNRQEISQQIAYLPQISTTLPSLKGEDFIKQGLYLKGKDQSSLLIHDLSVQHLLKKNCASMSGGEKQLLCFIRNLALEKSIILLDEPESFLSKSNRTLLANMITHLSTNSLIIVSSHHGELYTPQLTLHFNEQNDYIFDITCT